MSSRHRLSYWTEFKVSAASLFQPRSNPSNSKSKIAEEAAAAAAAAAAQPAEEACLKNLVRARA